MVWARVSIIWLNYNSSKILPIVLKSLESIIDLDYPSDRYELIVVDNGSTDGSFEKIREFLEEKGSLRKKVIKLDRNLGFAGSNNVGFLARDRESKYVVVVNNDCVVFEDSVKLYVEVMENFRSLGAAQGTVLKLMGTGVDSVGIYLTNVLIPFGFPKNSKEVLSRKVFLCSAVEGTFAIFRVEALLKAFSLEKVFEELLYGFSEDVFTCIQLWRSGFRTVFIAKPVALHRRGASWSSPTVAFLSVRNSATISSLFSEKHLHLLNIALMLRRSITQGLWKSSRGLGFYMLRGLVESRKLTKRMFIKYGRTCLPKAMPIIYIPLTRLLLGIASGRTLKQYVEHVIAVNLDKFAIGKV